MAATKKKTAKIPFGDMLSAIDRNDFDFYSRLDKDQKKAFSAWLCMRAASSAKGADAYHYLLMVNDIVNVDFSTLIKHPELQWKLLATCGIGHKSYHPFIHPGKKKPVTKIHKFLQNLHPTLNKTEIALLIEINDNDELRRLAEDNGYEDSDIDELFG
jgi:hypothetical protein